MDEDEQENVENKDERYSKLRGSFGFADSTLKIFLQIDESVLNSDKCTQNAFRNFRLFIQLIIIVIDNY